MDSLKREISQLESSFNLQEFLKRVFKYLVEGAAVAVAAYYIPRRKLGLEEILLVAVTAACTFAVLDMYAPSIAPHARQGTGFGIGANLAGFPNMN